MARQHCTGTGFLEAIRSAVANLEKHVDEINALNVFPVPDGDTGTNMLATVRAALEAAEAVGPTAPVGQIAAAVSHGALMGARGNSGVITSQILKGVAEGLAGRRRFNGLDLANALALGTKAAYGAVTKPVEGTILTVIRESADAAVATAEQDDAMGAVLAATVVAAEKSVARTPSLLPILREAGVVDSGGQGLLRLFEGVLLSVRGLPVHRGAGPTAGVSAGAGRVATPALGSRPMALEAGAYGYETVFILSARAGEALDTAAIRARLEDLGNSVLVGGDERIAKIHVHNGRPDEVLAYGLSLGVLTRITIENLDTMADDVREARASAFVASGTVAAADASTASGAGAAADASTASGAGAAPGAEASTIAPTPPRSTTSAAAGEPAPGGIAVATRATPAIDVGSLPIAPAATASANGSHGPQPVEVDASLGPAIVAVVAGEGLEKVFRDLGVDHIVHGGQTANPSTGELLRIARLARSREVIVLPNNPNVRLAAEQAARLCDDRRRSRPGHHPGDRGRARREDRRAQGEEGPDDRPRS